MMRANTYLTAQNIKPINLKLATNSLMTKYVVLNFAKLFFRLTIY